MKILQLINCLEVGGAEKLVTDLAPLIAIKDGYKCDVVVVTSLHDTIFEEILKEKGINVISLGCKSLYSMQAVFRLTKLFGFYDVVHVHLFPAQLWAVLAKILLGNKVKLITTEHSTNNRRREKSLFKLLDRFMYRKYDSVISISNDAQDSLFKWLNLKRGSEKYRVIHNGVDLSCIDNAFIVERAEIGVPEDATLVMCIGRLESVKNHRVQIEAISKLSDNFHLVLVGDGSLRNFLEKYAQTLEVAHRVHFLGIRSDVPSLIKMADVAILTSHWEGLSLACIEGMSCCPFIGADVNGIRDVIRGAGVLVANLDSEALAINIKRLANDDNYFQKVKADCRIRALQFDLNKTVAQYLEIFNTL